MTPTERLDRFQRRHPGAGFPLAVLYKYADDTGGYLAALIAYYAFVSLFPLLLLLSTAASILLSGDPALQHRVIGSTLSQFPVVGAQLRDSKRLGGGTIGLVVGILGALYGGLGVAQAFQHAMNTAWMVPRNSRPNPVTSRAKSLLLLATAGGAVVGTTVLSALGASGAGSLGPALKIIVMIGSIAINATVFVLVFRVATSRDVSVRDVAPGAIAAAFIWQMLQTFGVIYVNHVVRGASATNGVFAVVLGLLAFFYITATAVVLCTEANVVRVDRLYPRALLTPFTDNVDLTRGDRRAYANEAQAQRSKGFESIDVTFDEPDAPLDSRPRD